MKAIDHRTRMERTAVIHKPCSKCGRGLFDPAACIQGFCSQTNAIVYAQGGRTCRLWIPKED
jgi:hypothetical protein